MKALYAVEGYEVDQVADGSWAKMGKKRYLLDSGGLPEPDVPWIYTSKKDAKASITDFLWGDERKEGIKKIDPKIVVFRRVK